MTTYVVHTLFIRWGNILLITSANFTSARQKCLVTSNELDEDEEDHAARKKNKNVLYSRTFTKKMKIV
jgi:hypothetical protein